MGAMYQGISISTDQPSPSSDTAWCQWPSQSSLNWFWLVITASPTPPVEATTKLYPVRPSPSKSTIRLTRSTCSPKSRWTRWRVRGTDAGCRLRKATARPSGVASTQASVCSDAGSPESGWTLRKSTTWRAPAHSAGSMRPSTSIAAAGPASTARRKGSGAKQRGVMQVARWNANRVVRPPAPIRDRQESCEPSGPPAHRRHPRDAPARPAQRLGWSIVPVQSGAPQRQPQSFFSFGV